MTNEQLQQEIEALKSEIQNMKAGGTLQYEIGVAMKERLGDDFLVGGSSSTSVATYTQAVNEAGVASYNVAKVPLGFFSITVKGTTYNVAYY